MKIRIICKYAAFIILNGLFMWIFPHETKGVYVLASIIIILICKNFCKELEALNDRKPTDSH